MRRKHFKIRLMSVLLYNGWGFCTCLREHVCAGEGGVPRKKKRRSTPGPLGDFCIVTFTNSVSCYFVRKIKKNTNFI